MKRYEIPSILAMNVHFASNPDVHLKNDSVGKVTKIQVLVQQIQEERSRPWHREERLQ